MERWLFLFLFAFLGLDLTAQSAQIEASCGQAIESEFRSRSESQDLQINMEAGDVLSFKIVPLGDYLNVRVEIYDPGGTMIVNEYNGTFVGGKRDLQVKTGVLSGSGSYKIRVYNTHGDNNGRIGLFTTYFTCIKRNGEVIKP